MYVCKAKQYIVCFVNLAGLRKDLEKELWEFFKTKVYRCIQTFQLCETSQPTAKLEAILVDLVRDARPKKV